MDSGAFWANKTHCKDSFFLSWRRRRRRCPCRRSLCFPVCPIRLVKYHKTERRRQTSKRSTSWLGVFDKGEENPVDFRDPLFDSRLREHEINENTQFGKNLWKSKGQKRPLRNNAQCLPFSFLVNLQRNKPQINWNACLHETGSRLMTCLWSRPSEQCKDYLNTSSRVIKVLHPINVFSSPVKDRIHGQMLRC